MKITDIKKDAKVRLIGKYPNAVLMFFINFVMIMAFSALYSLSDNFIVIISYFILLSFFIDSLYFGLTSSMMNITRNEDTTTTKFIDIALHKFLKIIKISLRLFLKLLPALICMMISSFGLRFSISAEGISNGYIFVASCAIYVISLIWGMIKFISYSFTNYILHDNPDFSSNQILEESSRLLKNNIGKYILLNLSFILWYLLLFAILRIIVHFSNNKFLLSMVMYIGISFIAPYVTASNVVFYEDLVEEKKSEPIASNKTEN